MPYLKCQVFLLDSITVSKETSWPSSIKINFESSERLKFSSYTRVSILSPVLKEIEYSKGGTEVSERGMADFN